MKVEGRHSFAASAELLWALLSDPLALRQLLPGCEAFEAVAANEYRATVRLRVGAATERFDGMLLLEHAVPFTRFDFRAVGESAGGLVNCRGRVYLEDSAGDGGSARHTSLCYEAEIDVGGRLATLSDRLLETTARAFARRTLEGLERHVEMRTRIYTTTVDLPEAIAPASATTPHRLVAVGGVAGLLAALLALVLLLRGLDRRRTRRIAREVADLLEQAHAPGAMGPDAG